MKYIYFLLIPVFVFSCKKKSNDVAPANQPTTPNPNAVIPSGEAYLRYIKENDKVICDGTYDTDMKLVTIKFFTVDGKITSLSANTFTGPTLSKTLTTDFSNTGVQTDATTWEYEYGANKKMAKVSDYSNGEKSGYSEITYDASNRIIKNQGYSISNGITSVDDSYLKYEYENDLLKRVLRVYVENNETYVVSDFSYDSYGNVLTVREAGDSLVMATYSYNTYCYENNVLSPCVKTYSYSLNTGFPSRKVYLTEQFYYDYKVLCPTATIFKSLSSQFKDIYKFVHAPSSIIEYYPEGGISGTTSLIYSQTNSENYPTKVSFIGNGFNSTYDLVYQVP